MSKVSRKPKYKKIIEEVEEDYDSEYDQEGPLLSDEEINDRKYQMWKPAKFVSYETMALTSTKLNQRVRPCGFRPDCKNRMIKTTCLLGRMKKLNMIK